MVFLSVDAKDSTEVISYLADKLYENGYVKETYKNAVIEREKEFPTGLFMPNGTLAIPHTESEHVINGAIAVARLNGEVEFRYMGDPSEIVRTKLVFMLAIDDPSEQVPTLSELMSKFSDEEIIESLLCAEDVDKFLEILERN